jgi:hypothetical protein
VIAKAADLKKRADDAPHDGVLSHETDGVKVYLHSVEPTAEDIARYQRWWRDLVGRRLSDK